MTVRWRGEFFDGPLAPGTPYVADVHSFDVPETIARCIKNAQAGLVAVLLVDKGGRAMREAAEGAAAARGACVIWEDRTV